MVTNTNNSYQKALMDEVPKKRSKNKKYKCERCGRILSSGHNYKNHIDNNVCQKIKKTIECTECNKSFTDIRSLEYHIEHNVCGKCDIDDNPQNITNNNINTTNSNNTNTSNVLNQKIDTQNNQNIGTQNNIQINVNASDELKTVKLLPFRQMGYKVSTEKYLEYANNPEQAIKKFIKENHFNPDKPERMNVLNTNRRDNRILLFDYDDDFIARWLTKDKATIIELLYDRGMNHLFFAKMMLDGAGIKLDPKKEAKLKEKIKEYEDDKVKKKCLDMISDMTYDYREIIEENKKNIEKQQKQITNS